MPTRQHPCAFAPCLTDERLTVIARLLLDTRHEALLATDEELDDGYTKGARSWAWCKRALIQLHESGAHGWLSLPHNANDLVIGIGDQQARFFKDNAEHPRKHHARYPTEAERRCRDLFEYTNTAVQLWRFYIEPAELEGDDDRVVFAGTNEDHEIVAEWIYRDTGSVRTLYAVSNEIPAAKQLPAAEALPPITEDESDDQSSGHV